jgi:excisionase family DNA binding protein
MQSAGERESLQDPPLISVKDAARLLQVSRVVVYRRYHSGQFPGRKIGRKIDLHRPFVDALLDAICSGRSVDVDEFARQWSARNATTEAVAS